jgi:hypothetical protein
MQLGDQFYYLRNFEAMLATLESRDGDLLDADERDFMADFSALPLRSRALLVRMLMRKGRLFRASRLAYSEIDDVPEAMGPLVERRWVDDRPPLRLEQLFRLVTKADVARYFKLPKQRMAIPKSELLADLSTLFPEERTFDAWCESSADCVFRLEIAGLCERLRLMFFGNFRQDLTEFVLADLGVFKYEKVAMDADSRPFSTRRQVEDFHRLHHCRKMLHEGVDPAEIEPLLPSRIEDCEWLNERREKLLFQLARALERQGASTRAWEIYSQCGYPGASERAGRLREGAGGTARRRGPRKTSSAPEFTLVIEPGADGRSVEWRVLEHLTAAGGEDTSVHFVENTLINSLFGLLCWPAVFAPVPGAFFHAFHHGPADITSTRFRERREQEFARCFAELRCGSYKDTLRRRLIEKAGTSSPFVAWGLLDEALLETSLTCFPAAHLERWFDWIVRDVGANRSGFPDLVQFWPASGRYRLVEVKGPGDRLQDNQRRCLEYCVEHGMPVSVCHVRWEAA